VQNWSLPWNLALMPLVPASICVIVKVPALADWPFTVQLQLPLVMLPSRPDWMYAPLKVQCDCVTCCALGLKSTVIVTCEGVDVGLVCVMVSSSKGRIGPLLTPLPQLVPSAVRPPR